MRAVIFSIPMATSSGFAWRWRAEDDSKESAEAFLYYADCLTDAKRNGCDVELGRVESHFTLR